MVILFDQYHLPKDIFEIVFSTPQQVIVAKLLVNEMKANDGSLGKTGMSLFATKLHEGTLVEVDEGVRKKKVKVSYNKRQFYDRILTPMRTMGMIDYDMYKKTYSLSNRFNKLLIKIGLMWVQETERKQPSKITFESFHT